MEATWRDDEKPQAQVRPSAQNTDWNQVAKQIESNAGYQSNEIRQEGDVVTVSGEQTKYRDREKALERTAAILNNNTSEHIRVFKVIEEQDGIALTETKIDREKYVNAANYMSYDAEISDAFDKTNPETSDSEALASTKKGGTTV